MPHVRDAQRLMDHAGAPPDLRYEEPVQASSGGEQQGQACGRACRGGIGVLAGVALALLAPAAVLALIRIRATEA